MKLHHYKGGAAMNYFFSKNSSDPVYLPTSHNLKKAYGDNPEFLKRILPIMKSDYTSLPKKDEHGNALLNRIFIEANQKPL
jgi:hypothetical protein